MIRTKTRLQGRIIKAMTVDDVALLYIDFRGVSAGAPGMTVEARYKAIKFFAASPTSPGNP